MATIKSSEVKAALSAAPLGAFFDIPLELIIVEGQIRSQINQEGEAFLAHVESIREKGSLEPIIATPRDGKYRLISGERRLLACRKLGLATIPARVIDAVTAKDEVLALQLTENLQREDLDPIDTAKAVVGYVQARYGEEGSDVDGIINTMINLERESATTERVRKRPFSLYRRSVQLVRSGIKEQGDAFKKSDLKALLNDLRELVALVEGRLPEVLDDDSPAAEAPKKKLVLA